jgi:hypothetical protein
MVRPHGKQQALADKFWEGHLNILYGSCELVFLNIISTVCFGLCGYYVDSKYINFWSLNFSVEIGNLKSCLPATSPAQLAWKVKPAL